MNLENTMATSYTSKQIARMILANVRAMDSGKITWQQFGVVNRATWQLADRDELCIIGSAASRRVCAVQRELNALSVPVQTQRCTGLREYVRDFQ